MATDSDFGFSSYIKVFESRVIERRLHENEDVRDAASMAPWATGFTEVFLETLEDIGQIPSLETVYFEKKIGRSQGRINAYGVSVEDSRADLVVAVQSDNKMDGLGVVAGREVETAAKQALNLFRAAKDPIHLSMEPSSVAHDMMDRLHSAYNHTTSIRVVVLIDGLTVRTTEFTQPADLPKTHVDIWDLKRLFRADTSGLTYESFTIDLSDQLGRPLPCLAAKTDVRDHRCYLALFPGKLLHDLYDEYGHRLLELNVRSFLQARGKINRGIRDTLLRDPEHFLAYNNGISVTAEELDVVERSDGSAAIRSIRGLQIVNGGQTVASIHRAGSRDKVDLSCVHVQAKITVVDGDHLDTLVPRISRFANTQNKVNETDFSANHPYHVKMQRLSEQIWVPRETSRWFYERARGQWEVARAREGTTPAKRLAFDQRTPRQKKIDKTLLARTLNTWNELPHIVSLGGQKNFVHFMTDISEMGDNWEPEEQYYRDLISKVIIFKRAEKIARQIGFSAYRANAVCYTVSLLAYATAARVDMLSIWNNQNVSENLEETLRAWMPRVHEEIVYSAGHQNVTEWCKKKECWSTIQSLRLEFEGCFQEELAQGLPLPTVGRHKPGRSYDHSDLGPEERDRQAKTMRYESTDWLKIVAWGRDTGLLNDFQIKLAGTILGYAAGGWNQVPSPKQTKHAVEILEIWNAKRIESDSEEIQFA